MISQIHVVAAAAGSGKTTQLVGVYLELLQRFAPHQIIAITFTRAAAAELVDRVALALHAAAGDAAAQDELGGAWAAVYRDKAPKDPDVIAKALRGLPAAPVGTTDSFVQSLLSEFALDAALPVPNQAAVPLDLPLALGDSARVFEAAARSVLDPPDGAVPAAAVRCLRYLTLGETLTAVRELAMASPGAPALMLAQLWPQIQDAAAQILRAVYLTGGQKPGKALHEDVAKQWLADGATDELPDEAVAYLSDRLSKKANDVLALQAHIATLPPMDFGCAQLDLGQALRAFGQFAETHARDAADVLRADLLALAEQSRALALPVCAATGDLDYSLLTQIAIALCENPPRSLRRRFSALLVDEAQDASPEQMQLYAALSALPGGQMALQTHYVGDARQSIYLFRGAEPKLFDSLITSAAQTGTLTALDVNRRSTPSLVQAQKALFGAVAHLPGLMSVANVTSVAQNAKNELPTDTWPQPVVIAVPQPDEKWSAGETRCAALDLFAQRVIHAWRDEKRPTDTAAVLTQSWAKARHARDYLQALLGANIVFLTGEPELASSRTIQDIRVLIAALWDPSNRLAWAALYKLPCIGLTDAALALLSEGLGLLENPLQVSNLASAIWAGALDPRLHSASDVRTFARIAPIVRRAVQTIGRLPTADVVETLAAALHWRAILLAGPDGQDALGQFEVAMDWLRSGERDGVDPDSLLELLDPEQKSQDAPQVHIERGAGVLVCTTTFQAKGLEWDHVCALDVGSSRAGEKAGDATTWHGAPVRLHGVTLDPAGALDAKLDPIGKLSGQIDEKRRAEERLRVAYVAITRAKRSLTLATGKVERNDKSLTAHWSALTLPGVEVRAVAVARTDVPRASAWVRVTRAFATAPAQVGGWKVVSPSATAQNLSKSVAESLVARVSAAAELHLGGPLQAMVAVQHMTQTDRGDLVHGWMANGGLEQVPILQQAIDYLQQRWQSSDLAVAQWLLGLSQELAKRQPELFAILSEIKAIRRHEWPLLGVDGDRLYSGQMDLLLERPNGELWIIDFKGWNFLTKSDWVKQGNLHEYVPQLEAYRAGVQGTGRKVSKLVLLYAGQWSWIGW